MITDGARGPSISGIPEPGCCIDPAVI